MDILLSCQKISKSFGSKVVFKNFDFGVGTQEKIGLIGENGAGKSTLLKILAGGDHPDEGQVSLKKGLRMVYVGQDSLPKTHHLVSETFDDFLIQKGIKDERFRAAQVASGLSLLPFADSPLQSLSGGHLKRVAIVAALICEPDLLLLDEPTNHLDIWGVLWLEDLLRKPSFSFIVVSHDRYFLEKVVNQIAEINPLYQKGVLKLPGSYHQFMEQKRLYRDNLEATAQSLASKMRRESAWLARGPKARGTKSKQRIQKAHELSSEIQSVKERLKESEQAFEFSTTERRTKKLIEAKDLGLVIGEKELFQDLSFDLGPQSVLGICGPNGCGKSSLLKILNDELPPRSGTVKKATQLQVVYFDQHRESLDLEESLKRALGDGAEGVTYQNRSIHVMAWAQKFGFSADQMHLPLKDLSGGERARVLISKLIRREADVLLLDEPTNDLDIKTLEILEDSLRQFKGAVVLTSHDRYLMQSVCDQVVGFLEPGHCEVFADLYQWELAFSLQKKDKDPKPKPASKGAKKAAKKLSYLEQREFDGMEEAIELKEKAMRELEEEATKKASDAIGLLKVTDEMSKLQEEIDRFYSRWAELDFKQAD